MRFNTWLLRIPYPFHVQENDFLYTPQTFSKLLNEFERNDILMIHYDTSLPYKRKLSVLGHFIPFFII